MRRLTLLLLGLLLALPCAAFAGNRSCNTTLVGQSVCRSSTNLVLFYDAPGSAFADLRDAIAAEYNYQDEVVCASSRQFEPLLNGQSSSVLSAAGAATDSCSVGSVVANPQGSGEFADAVIDMELRNRVIQWKHNTAVEEAADPTAIETPDVGAP
jgi:hypothetical protein